MRLFSTFVNCRVHIFQIRLWFFLLLRLDLFRKILFLHLWYISLKLNRRVTVVGWKLVDLNTHIQIIFQNLISDLPLGFRGLLQSFPHLPLFLNVTLLFVLFIFFLRDQFKIRYGLFSFFLFLAGSFDNSVININLLNEFSLVKRSFLRFDKKVLSVSRCGVGCSR
jgi:hypothetical protein